MDCTDINFQIQTSDVKIPSHDPWFYHDVFAKLHIVNKGGWNCFKTPKIMICRSCQRPELKSEIVLKTTSRFLVLFGN